MKFDQYLSGMVELRVPETCPMELLQQMTDAGVHLHQIQRKNDGLRFWIMLDDFYVVQQLLRARRCPFHVQGKRGFPFLISMVKRRKGLWVGCCLCFSLIYLLNSFIWGYAVAGNEQYSNAHMIALVQEYGLLPGARLDKFDYDKLQQQIILDHPEFTWIQLRPKGTTLQITIKERQPGEVEQRRQGSITASADGRITELLVFRGTPLVERGDWVKKGQVLVGGWDYPDRERDASGNFAPIGEPFAVRAKGVIRGQQERSVVASCALEERLLQSTGNRKKQYALAWRGHQLVVWGPREMPYACGSQEIRQRSILSWQQFHLPVYLRTTVFEEKTLRQCSYSQEEAYLTALERARKRLQEQMPAGAEFIRESYGLYQSAQKDVVQVKVVWIIEANLAEMQQLDLPESLDEESSIAEKE